MTRNNGRGGVVLDKKIERIKKEIKHRNRLYLATALVGRAAIAVDLSGFPASAYTNPDAASFVQGFLIGLFAAVEVFSVIKLVKNCKALGDETTLRRLYNKYHDERELHIESLAARKGLEIATLVSVLAGLVVCYFSFEAFLGMLAVVIIAGAARECSKAYYNRTYTGE